MVKYVRCSVDRITYLKTSIIKYKNTNVYLLYPICGKATYNSNTYDKSLFSDYDSIINHHKHNYCKDTRECYRFASYYTLSLFCVVTTLSFYIFININTYHAQYSQRDFCAILTNHGFKSAINRHVILNMILN